MNSGARTRHRVMTTALALALPAVLFVGLGARKGIVDNSELPAVRPALDDFTNLRASHDAVTIAGGVVDVRLVEGSSGALAVEFLPRSAVAAADVLVYWTPEATVTESLPEVSLLVGSLAGPQPRKYLLPEIANRTLGQLIFYSLAHETITEGRIEIDPGRR